MRVGDLRVVFPILLAGVAALGVIGPAQAEDGRIPLCLPVGATSLNISDSGSYYLSEDISVSRAGAVIYIWADDVTLDLDGHTISNTNTTSSLGLIYASGYTGIHISNGHLVGGQTGIYLMHSTARAEFAIGHVMCHGQGQAGIEVHGSSGFPVPASSPRSGFGRSQNSLRCSSS